MKLFLTSHYLKEKHFAAFKKLLGKDKAKKALFITTASIPYGHNPKPQWLIESIEDMSKLTESYDETSLEDENYIPDNLDPYDFIFVTGGNSFYLAYRLVKTGMNKKILDYIEKNGIYSGSSAGAIILMHNISYFAPADNPEEAPEIYSGLGVIDEVIMPHADSKKYGEIMRDIADRYKKEGKEIFSLNDDQILIINNKQKQIL